MPNWHEIELPNTWPDAIDLKRPVNLVRFLALFFSKRRNKVVLPELLMGREQLPKYILQEFHNLPNGNYSNKIVGGYVRGFDISMLGKLTTIRKQLAKYFVGMSSVLDMGCGGGKMADSIRQQEVPDVWGLDASPYLLKHAARQFPDINFVHGLAEECSFPAERFCGISVFFVLHEIPPKQLKLVLNEMHRVLKPGGSLVICEPSNIQYQNGWWYMFKNHGFTGLYFKYLAHSVHEPYVQAWHKQNVTEVLAEHGFDCVISKQQMPFNLYMAKKAN